MTSIPFDGLRLADSDFANPRQTHGLDADSILELACTIVLHGLLSPLVTSNDGLVLGGQRRYLAIRAIIGQSEAVLAHARAAYDAETAAELADLLDERRSQFIVGVPVTIADERSGAADIALVDNIHREALTTYEVAKAVVEMAGAKAGSRMGVRAIARRIGKDKSYVSRLMAAWSNASAELHRAWRAEEIPFARVLEISQLPFADQAELVATDRADVAAGRRRGGHGRPGVDKLKAMLAAAEGGTVELTANWTMLMEGVRVALRYAVGQIDEETFLRSCGHGISHERLDKVAK